MSELNINTKTFKSLSDMFELDDKISFIAGPCSIESWEQMELIAIFMKSNNIHFIRGGAYKPRTSPYSFQGLGLEDLKILDEIRKKYQLFTISEIMNPRDVEVGIEHTDILQIGFRNMQNYSLLKEVGKTRHPVLLKRGMMASVFEFMMAAEYIVMEGNCNLILCERGIRTFDSATRYTLDLSCIAIIKKETNLPIIVDLSHSLGRKDIMAPMIKCVKALEVDGIMLEVHPNPSQAKSDVEQQLSLSEFEELL